MLTNAPVRRRTIGLRDIAVVLWSPKRVFERVENVPAYGWSLLLLLIAVTVVGYAQVQTGLIDRKVEQGVQEQIAKLDLERADVVARSELRKQTEDIQKGGEFEKFLARLAAVVVEPAGMLTSVLLLAAVFYGLVALSGRKPEWHSLMSVVVFASFVDVAAMVFRLILVVQCGTLDVDTSAGAVARAWASDAFPQKSLELATSALSGLDPFRLWFWVMVLIGLKATAQLRGWRAWVPCVFLWLLAAGIRTGMVYGMSYSGGTGG